jgi:hypothetical protein
MIAVLMLLLTLEAGETHLIQQSSGWCSPNVAYVRGNVTITCKGVDPQALKRMNEELSAKGAELSDKIKEANRWAERYHPLKARLGNASRDDEMSKKAAMYLHAGNLEKAGALLDEILMRDEKKITQMASDHYNRALVFQLEFRPLDALPHFAKAYQYRPEELSYGQAYGDVLQTQNDLPGAEAVFQGTLSRARELEKQNPGTYKWYVGWVLGRLGALYHKTQRLSQAESAFLEAADIGRELAKRDPSIYDPSLTAALNGLTSLYIDTQQFSKAESACQEILQSEKRLQTENTEEYNAEASVTLTNLANIYLATRRWAEAEASYRAIIEAQRQLVTRSPAYRPELARTLNNLGNLYSQIGRQQEAEANYKEAIGIRRELTKENAAAYGPDLARTLNNLAILYSSPNRFREAEDAYNESLSTFRLLAKQNPEAYEPASGNWTK